MNRMTPRVGSRYSYRGRKLEVLSQRRSDLRWHLTFRWEDTHETEEREATWFGLCVSLPAKPQKGAQKT